MLPLLTAAAGQAFAADVPGNTTTRATLTFGPAAKVGVFDKTVDSDWHRITLTKGRTYAFGLASNAPPPFRVILRDGAGKVLKTSFNGFDFRDTGVEHTAERSGTYFVEALLDADTPLRRPAGYRLTANIDCAGEIITDCSLRPGKAAQRLLTWGEDVDHFRVSLTRGQAYRVELDGYAPQDLEASLLDARGLINVVEVHRLERFVPRRSGTYFVRVRNTNVSGGNGGRYVVRLTQP